jgi:hypothetical protein
LFAQSYLTSDEPLWFTLADCAASTLITGRAPEILRAIRLVPGPPQHGLATIDIAGNPDYRLDPHSDDFYRRLVDLRASVKTRAKAAKHAGDHELARLDAEQLVLKLIANATSYGCFIELNPTDLEELVKVTAYGLDGEPFATQVQRHEKPGASFHLLLATLITGAARLMLVSAERLALDAGLDWAFMDTDSIALTRPDDITSEDFRQRVAGIRGWSEVLNSYDTKGSLLELEDINRGLGADGTLTDDLEPLYCLVVSPKRATSCSTSSMASRCCPRPPPTASGISLPLRQQGRTQRDPTTGRGAERARRDPVAIRPLVSRHAGRARRHRRRPRPSPRSGPAGHDELHGQHPGDRRLVLPPHVLIQACV